MFHALDLIFGGKLKTKMKFKVLEGYRGNKVFVIIIDERQTRTLVQFCDVSCLEPEQIRGQNKYVGILDDHNFRNIENPAKVKACVPQ